MLVESKILIDQALTINSVGEFTRFMAQNFQPVLVKDFPDEIISEIKRTNVYRIANKDYLRFYGLIFANSVAGFGFKEAGGQKLRHNYHKFKLSYTTPIHLAALDRYMAEKTLEASRQKRMIIDTQERALGRALKDSEREAIWGVNKLGENSQVIVETPKGLKKDHETMRPIVVIPDEERLKEVMQLNLTGKQADMMSAGEFAVTQLPVMERVYGRYVDVHKVFFGPGEKWAA